MIRTLEVLENIGKPATFAGVKLLWHKDQRIPGSTQYSIKRYSAHQWTAEDTGMLIYHYFADQPKQNYLELRFCIAGNKFCDNKVCGNCHEEPTEDCEGPIKTVDIFAFHFTSTFLHQLHIM